MRHSDDVKALQAVALVKDAEKDCASIMKNFDEKCDLHFNTLFYDEFELYGNVSVMRVRAVLSIIEPILTKLGYKVRTNGNVRWAVPPTVIYVSLI